MPRKPLGDRPLTNAERQAGHRAAHAASQPVIHYRPAANRAAAPGAGAMPSTNSSPCKASTRNGSRRPRTLARHRHRRGTACHPRSRPRRDLCLPSSHRTALYGIRHAARPRIPASGARPRGPQARIAPPDSRGSLHNARVPPMDPLDDSLPPQCSRSPRDQPRKAHFNSAVSRRPVKINSFLIFVGQSRNRVTALHLKVV